MSLGNMQHLKSGVFPASYSLFNFTVSPPPLARKPQTSCESRVTDRPLAERRAEQSTLGNSILSIAALSMGKAPFQP